MRTLTLSITLFTCAFAGFAQKPAEKEQKAPAKLDKALHARVNQFYDAFMSGKYTEAYKLVAEGSQDGFLAADKEQYKGCETVKIHYSNHFKEATVLESCKTDWVWHGLRTPTRIPLTTTWKLVDRNWFWYYTKPKEMPFPFSPTGFIPIPSQAEIAKAEAAIPKNMGDAARNILSQVSVNKQVVNLGGQSSMDTVTVHNSMPGEIQLQVDPVSIPGLKITLDKAKLEAKQDATVTFEYSPDDKACTGCAKNITGNPVAVIHVIPTEQLFQIRINLAPADTQGRPR